MVLRYCVLLLGTLVVLAVPDFADAQKKPAAKDKADNNESLVKLGEFVVTLTQVEGAQKYLTVQYTQHVVVPNLQAGLQNGWNLMRRQIEIMRNPNPLYRRQLLMQLLAEQQRNRMNAVQVRQVPVSLELQATDELKVRVLQPPADFDDRGRPRRYTKKELKEMKGPDPKQPGYTAEFDQLKPGQTVQVALAQRKDALRKLLRKVKAADADVDVPPGPKEGADRLIVTRVVILAEPPR